MRWRALDAALQVADGDDAPEVDAEGDDGLRDLRRDAGNDHMRAHEARRLHRLHHVVRDLRIHRLHAGDVDDHRLRPVAADRAQQLLGELARALGIENADDRHDEQPLPQRQHRRRQLLVDLLLLLADRGFAGGDVGVDAEPDIEEDELQKRQERRPGALRLGPVGGDEPRRHRAQIEAVHAEIGLDRQADALMHGADPQPVPAVGEIVIALGQALQILPLLALDPFQHLRVLEQGAAMLEGEKVLVKILDDPVAVAARQIIDADEALDVIGTEFEEFLARRQLGFVDLGDVDGSHRLRARGLDPLRHSCPPIF